MASGARSDGDRIGDYLLGLPADQRAALEDLRAKVRNAAPMAVEAISYGTPAFRYLGHPLVSYGAGKSHCAFYVMSPAVIESMKPELADHDTSKGAIRFQPGEPLSQELVTAIVEARMAESDARWGQSSR